MTEQWRELKETITELRDNDGTGTQQEVCKFLVNYMDVLEKQMQEPCEDVISRKEVLNQIFYSTDNSGDVVLGLVLRHRIESLPPVTPQQSCEDVAKAFQIGMALGFGEKHDEMDKVIDEIKKAVKPQEKTKRCKECKYSEYCRRWGNKYKTEEDDYCFMFEPQESEG